MSNGLAGFTKLFMVFITVFGMISLLMNNVAYILLSVFGLALGLLWKRGNIKGIVKIAILIFSLGAVVYLPLWFQANMQPITYLSLWFGTDVLPVAAIAVLAVTLGREGWNSNSIILKMATPILGVVGIFMLALWSIANIVQIYVFSVYVLPILLPAATGFSAVALTIDNKKREEL